MRKGQLLSMDFAVAVAILALALGIFVQSSELAQKNANSAKLAASPSDSMAELMVEGRALPPAGVVYAFEFSNGTRSADWASLCQGNSLGSRRVTYCRDNLGAVTSCLLQVKTCG